MLWIVDHSVPSRPDSRSSNSSVNTIEDLSLAFNQTIALGEETLGIDSDDEMEGIRKIVFISTGNHVLSILQSCHIRLC